MTTISQRNLGSFNRNSYMGCGISWLGLMELRVIDIPTALIKLLIMHSFYREAHLRWQQEGECNLVWPCRTRMVKKRTDSLPSLNRTISHRTRVIFMGHCSFVPANDFCGCCWSEKKTEAVCHITCVYCPCYKIGDFCPLTSGHHWPSFRVLRVPQWQHLF